MTFNIRMLGIIQLNTAVYILIVANGMVSIILPKVSMSNFAYSFY